jgi:hypothetical protein
MGRALTLAVALILAGGPVGVACSEGDGSEEYAEAAPSQISPPLPPSDAPIAAVRFDFGSRARMAPGSDNWPLTWAADGAQYTSWGDGGGFGGTNRDGRVSLGVARIEGPAHHFRGINVWGGKGARHAATFGGKSYGILALESDLYLWVAPGSDGENLERQTLHRSTDGGATWTAADWSFTAADRIALPAFVQFGPGYAGARDESVYMAASRMDAPEAPADLSSFREGKVDLFRAPASALMDRSSYEFFAGLDDGGQARWTPDPASREPIIDTPGRTMAPRLSVTYNAGLRRYLLAVEQDGSRDGNLNLYEAREPWGPWRHVAGWESWGGFSRTFYWCFSNAWTSEDGRDFVLVFTGKDDTDSWNHVRGRFVLEGEAAAHSEDGGR